MVRSQRKIGNYRIVERIADSNYAELYAVVDDKGDNSILKIARSGNSADNELITREYSILSQINHPNIVKVYDYDKHNERSYFTLEFIPGKPINEYFKGFSEDFVVVLLQILSALGAFHNKGFVHCDLKPENILYDTNERQAKLIDFGFAGSPDHNLLAAGTLKYIAPEVIKGIAINQNSDMYSLGVIMYEILSGQAFTGKLKQIKGLPSDISKMLSRLVSAETALRPTIPELYQTFTKYAPSSKVEPPIYEVRLPGTAYIDTPALLGKLHNSVGEVIVVVGETGLGKTRLLQELKFQYLTNGFEIIHYAAKAKAILMDTFLRYLGKLQADVLQAEDKFQIFEQILRPLLKISKHKKIAILIDDIDILSDYERSLFRYIGYGIASSNILVVGTSTMQNSATNLGFDSISLKPLSQTGTALLIEKTFGQIAYISSQTPEIFMRWLHKQSGGNPLFIIEILKTLYDREILYYKSNRWNIKTNQLTKVILPPNLEELITTRIANLPTKALMILKIMCLAEYPLRLSFLSSMQNGQFSLLIERLKNLNLIREIAVGGQRSYQIANRMLAGVIERNVEKREMYTLCKKLITAIEKAKNRGPEYALILADLYGKISNVRKAYEHCQIVVNNLESIYDYDTTLKYYNKIITLAQRIDKTKLHKYHIMIGDLNQRIGNPDVAVKHYHKALESHNKNLVAKAQVGLGKVEAIKGQYNEAIAYYRQAMKYIDKKSIDYVTLANLLGYALINVSKYDKALEFFNKALNLARELSNLEDEARTLYAMATLEWYRQEYQKGIDKSEKLLIFCKKHKLLTEYPLVANLLGLFHRQLMHIEKARDYFGIAVEQFSEIRRLDALCASMHNNAQLLAQLGKYDAAERLLLKSLNIAQQTNNKSVYVVSLTNSAIINSTLGKYAKAIEQYNRVLSLNPNYMWAVYGKTTMFIDRNKISEAINWLDEHITPKKEILYIVATALIELIKNNYTGALESLCEAANAVQKERPDISIRLEAFLKISWLYHEMGNFEASAKSVTQLLEITAEGGREYNIARALMKMNDYAMDKTESIDIDPELFRLKEIGCIYDYAYLVRLRVDAKLNHGLEQMEVREVVEDLNRAQEIFESLGAELELSKLRKTQGRLFPLIVEDYSTRVISDQYLKTFSGIAELISSNLGDEHFIQDILDLVIKATNAERGALFVKTTKGMDFVAGRNMDKTTIKDASELSRTAIKQLEKGKILFAQDALSDPTFNIKKSVMLHQIHSLLCIPLSVSGNIIGAIYLDSRITSGIFGPQDKDFLMAISKILASVVEKSLAFRSLSEENILLKTNIIREIGSGHLMGKSRVMKEVYRLIDSVGETNSPVLILGETGTGKGMIARLIHLRSQRKNKKFLSINCGTIPETLLESELFGHKKGAFTGAISDKKGLLEEGEGGTVFLDEITNTSLEFQGKLLEAIEEKIIRRVGETTTRNIDVRFLFATNKDLEVEVEDNRFRRDLFYRINVFKIEVPPLRDRAGDIPFLAQFFLERYTKEINKKIDGFAPEAMQRLREYFWPGNVRELQNVIERAVVLAKSKLISTQDIGFEKAKTAEVLPLKQIKKEAMINVITKALSVYHGSVTETAKALGINRKTIQRYIKKYKIRKHP
jgi:Nif-specific regulatory protein